METVIIAQILRCIPFLGHKLLENWKSIFIFCVSNQTHHHQHPTHLALQSVKFEAEKSLPKKRAYLALTFPLLSPISCHSGAQSVQAEVRPLFDLREVKYTASPCIFFSFCIMRTKKYEIVWWAYVKSNVYSHQDFQVELERTTSVPPF